MFNWQNNNQQNQSNQSGQQNSSFGFGSTNQQNQQNKPLQLGFSGQFGQNASTNQGSQFGQNAPMNQFGQFGAPSQPNQPNQPNSFGFGSNSGGFSNTSSFGSSTSNQPNQFGTGFSSTNSSFNQNKPFSSFNQTGTTSPFNKTSSGIFGSTQSSYTGTQPQFGTAQSTSFTKPTQFGSFSSSSQPQSQPQSQFTQPFQSTPFGANKPAQPTQFGATSSQPPYATTPSAWNTTNTWSAPGNRGTQAAPYSETRVKDDNRNLSLIDATGMVCYREKSNDELRKEDYDLGRKNVPTNATATTTTSPFGSSGPTGNQANFTSQPNLMNTTSPFGPPSQGQPAATNPFGQPGSTQPQNPFASNPFTPTLTTPTTNPFTNTLTTPTTNPFGNPPTTNPFGATSQTNPLSHSSLHQHGPQTSVNLSDPYLISHIQFPTPLPTKPAVRISLPEPIFSRARGEEEFEIEIRPPRKYLSRSIYTIPEDIEDGKVVSRLVIGFEGKGRIEYTEPVTFSRSGLDDIIVNGTDVVINDKIGTGYNKRARVVIEGVYPYSRSSGSHIRGKQETWPNRGLQERFIYGLKSDINKKYVDYDCENGVYVYEVEHF